MNKRKLDLHLVHLTYQVNVKEVLDSQKEERTKFFQDIESSNIRKSGIVYKKILDLLFRHIESRTSVFFKSIFDTIPAYSGFEPDFKHEIFYAIDNFIDQAVVEVKRLIDSRISRDRLSSAVRDSIRNDLNSRSSKIKSYFKNKAHLEIEKKCRASEIVPKPPEKLREAKWLWVHRKKHKFYVLLFVGFVTIYIAYKLIF